MISMILWAVFGYWMMYQTVSFVEAKENRLTMKDYRAINQKLEARIDQLEKENKSIRTVNASNESFVNEMREKINTYQELIGDCERKVRQYGGDEVYTIF